MIQYHRNADKVTSDWSRFKKCWNFIFMRASYYQKIALQKISDYNHNVKLQELNRHVYSPIREEQELQYQQQNVFLDTIQIVNTQLHYHRPRRNYIKPTDLNKNYTMMWLRSKGIENKPPSPVRDPASASLGRRQPLMLTADKFNQLFVAQSARALAKAERLSQLSRQQEIQYQRTDFAGLCEQLSGETTIEDVIEYLHLQQKLILNVLILTKMIQKYKLLQQLFKIKQAKEEQPELNIQLDEKGAEQEQMPETVQVQKQEERNEQQENQNEVDIEIENTSALRERVKNDYTSERKFIAPYNMDDQ